MKNSCYGIKHRGKRMFYYKYFTLNKMKEVHIMSKKILKRSLALGALMAFVITGNVWAYEQPPYEGKEYKGENPTVVDDGTANGNVIYKNGTVNIKNCDFIENILKATGTYKDKNGKDKGYLAYGGAVYVIGDLNVEGGSFVGNSVTAIGNAYGGAIAHQGGNLSITGTTFSNNSAGKYGAAIYASGSTEVKITNSVFENHPAAGTGLVYATGNYNIILAGGNIFDKNGSACISLQNGSLRLQGENTFINNTNNSIVNKGTVTFETGSQTYFKDNTAKYDFGGKGDFIIEDDAYVESEEGITTSGDFEVNGKFAVGDDSEITNFSGDGGTIRYLNNIDLTVTNNTATNLNLEASGEANDAVGGDARSLIGESFDANDQQEVVTLIMDEGDATGRVTAKFVKGENGKLVFDSQSEETNTKNQAIGEAGVALKLHHRAHMNDMNKRMGELRNANGEHGVWVRMVRGESEYENTKAQYNQYQLGYDEKLSVDKRWTVGAAVTFAEGDANYGKGTTDDKSTAFAIYGSKLNNDGTFVDLIARYAHLESDLDDVHSGKGDYSTNGMSVSAEFGKRIQQGNGLWIEPQVELTYGTVDSADFKLGRKTVHVGEMDSFIARAGFSLGKDIKQGNVYARASYLYDFDGETVNAFTASGTVRPIEEDLGGGWWEVGVGANINLSKATYIYADVEKTFGGEVDTNWQWNLGVRYSF